MRFFGRRHNPSDDRICHFIERMIMKDTSCFKIKIDNHVAWLILNRPEKRNTMGLSFFSEIEDLFDELDRDPNVRVVIIKA